MNMIILIYVHCTYKKKVVFKYKRTVESIILNRNNRKHFINQEESDTDSYNLEEKISNCIENVKMYTVTTKETSYSCQQFYIENFK